MSESWLIEDKNTPPELPYYAAFIDVTDGESAFSWTADINEAVKCTTEDDAKAVAFKVFGEDHGHRIVLHQFPNPVEE